MISENAIDSAALDEIAAEYEEQPEEGTELAEAPEIPTHEILLPVITLATAMACPNWQITEDENRMLAESYAAILDKYFPNAAGNFGVEINALLITGAVFMPRLGKPPKLPPQDKDYGQKSETGRPVRNEAPETGGMDLSGFDT